MHVHRRNLNLSLPARMVWLAFDPRSWRLGWLLTFLAIIVYLLISTSNG